MATTQEQKELMEDLCGTIRHQVIGVKNCYVDDYGRYGNFQIVVSKERKRIYINGKKRDFRGIMAGVRKFIKQVPGAHLRSNELYPADKNVMIVDIDFQKYDENSNTFSS
jgi:hypothetical protein